MRYFLIIFTFICILVVSVLGFRGCKSTNTPLYIFPDMDWQAKYQPQGENAFFKDRRNDRPVVPGTVVRGQASEMEKVFSEEYVYDVAERPEFYSGKNDKGEWIVDFPLEVDHQLMELGRDKYNIFCVVCHGASGDGNGITKKYGMIATASYHDDRVRKMPIGEVFNTISYGKGQMLSYADKLSPHERWAVISYVRALQRSQHATEGDVPEEFKPNLGL